MQKKSLRIITGSEYLAHTEPLFKALEILKVEDLHNLKLLKFYYNLSYELLPTYFDCYLEVINKKPPGNYKLRSSARPVIRMPRTRLVFTESSVLYQLIQLLNYTYEHQPIIMAKIIEKSYI